MPPHNKASVEPHENGNGRPKEMMKLEAPTATVVVPPDGGWGWVVMVASFCCNLIVDGMVMSASAFHVSYQNEFGASTSSVTLVSSLLSGFYLIAGPFVSALANKWGFRPVTMVGAVIASAAFAASSLANGVVYLYFIYGFVGGIGFSMIYIPAVLTVGYYFEKWRAIATGIALCGSGVGTMVFVPLNNALINSVGWRNALLIQAAIILSCSMFGFLFRPLKPIQVSIEDEPLEKEKMLPVIFTKPLPEGRYAFSVPNSAHNTWIGASSNSHYPTAAEVFRNVGGNVERRPSGTPTTTGPSGGVLTSSNMKKLEQLSKAQRRSSGQSTPEDVSHPPPAFNNFNIPKELVTVGEAEDEENENETLIETIKPIMLTERRHTVSGRRPILPNSKGGSRRGTITDNRPMYRDDIFFSGSLVRIPKYQSQSSLGYHMSVTRLPTVNDVEEVSIQLL